MNICELKDCFVLAKLPDDRVMQVIISRDESLLVLQFISGLSGGLKLLDKAVPMEFERPA